MRADTRIAEPAEVAVPAGIEPLAPVAGRWTKLRQPPAWHGIAAEAWLHEGTGIGVISTLTTVDGMPSYLLAVSRNGKRRITTTEGQRVLLQYGVPRAEEVRLPGSGFVRHFVAPVPVVKH